ncbi:MAG: hypothetical protein U0271_43460 [Polyangiaceae bacterium]
MSPTRGETMKDALVQAWTTSVFGVEEVQARLEALLDTPSDDVDGELIRRVDELGAALRLEHPERILEAAALYCEALPWRVIAGAPGVGGKVRGLGALIDPIDLFEFVGLCKKIGAARNKLDAAVAIDALSWLLAADEEALERTQERMRPIALGDPRRSGSIPITGPVGERWYQLLAGRFEDPREELRWLASTGGYYRLMSNGAAAIARRLDITLDAPGLTQRTGGVSAKSVWHEDAKPLLELAFKISPDLFHEVFPVVASCPSLGSDHWDWLTRFVDWDASFDVESKAAYARFRRHGPLTLIHRGNQGKAGTLTVKRERSEAAAEKSLATKLSESEKKLEASSSKPRVPRRPANLHAALLEACRSCDREAVSRYLQLEPELSAQRGGELLVEAASDPWIAAALLETGVEPGSPYDERSSALDKLAGDASVSEFVRLLVERGAPLGQAVLTAAHTGALSSLQLLLARGADPRSRFASGSTVLELAERRNDAAVAAWLVRRALEGAPIPLPPSVLPCLPKSALPNEANARAAAPDLSTGSPYAAFATASFDALEVERRFRAVLDQADPKLQDVAAARVVGAVLRLEGIERVRQAVEAFCSLVDWEVISQHPGGVMEGPLSILCHGRYQAGERALLDVGFDDVVQLMRAADKPDAELGRAVLEHLAFGDEAALATLTSRIKGDSSFDQKLGVSSTREINLRVYDVLRRVRADRLETPRAELEWALAHGSSNFHLTALTSLTTRMGLSAPSGQHQWGDHPRNDLRAFVAALSIDWEVASSALTTWCKQRYVDSDDWLMSELDLAQRDEDWELRASPQGRDTWTRVVRVGALVITQDLDTKNGVPILRSASKLAAKRYASASQAQKEVDKLLGKAEKNRKAKRTPYQAGERESPERWLAFAVESRDRQLVRALVEQGVKVAPTEEGDDPMWIRLLSSDVDPELLADLLRAGVDPNARDRDGDPAIGRLYLGIPDTVDALAALGLMLAAGADPNARASDGQTALHYAAANGQAAATALLVKHGADATLLTADDRARTAEQLAREGGELHVAALLART